MIEAQLIIISLSVFALVFLILAIVAIHPSLDSDGVAIRSVAKNSSASLAGIPNPKPGLTPMSREKIIMINNVPIKNIDDYYEFISTLKTNRTVRSTN